MRNKQHIALRFFLWRLGLLPWDLVAYLDEATERLLLRKVGVLFLSIDCYAMFSRCRKMRYNRIICTVSGFNVIVFTLVCLL
jgi:hypothetical protein